MILKKRKNEIGGEFYLKSLDINKSANQFVDLLKNFQFEFFDTGRSAISYILNQIQGKNVLLPAYICQSVINVFKNKSFNITFYNINKNLTIDIQDFGKKCNNNIDIVYFINYYGQIQPNDILLKVKKLSKLKNFVIIEDSTHSLFSSIQTIGDYCIASLRKWGALPDGAVAYTNSDKFKKSLIKDENYSFSNLRLAAMLLKGIYLETKNETYRQIFNDAEKIIDEGYELFKMTKLSIKILENFDIETLISIRKQNYNYLEKNINNKLITPILEQNNANTDLQSAHDPNVMLNSFQHRMSERPCDPEINSGRRDSHRLIATRHECRLFFPIYCENRDKLQKYLENNKIYCPIHWPVNEEKLLEFSNIDYISKHILSLPIDQRYNLNDMKFVCKILNNYKG